MSPKHFIIQLNISVKIFFFANYSFYNITNLIFHLLFVKKSSHPSASLPKCNFINKFNVKKVNVKPNKNQLFVRCCPDRTWLYLAHLRPCIELCSERTSAEMSMLLQQMPNILGTANLLYSLTPVVFTYLFYSLFDNSNPEGRVTDTTVIISILIYFVFVLFLNLTFQSWYHFFFS